MFLVEDVKIRETPFDPCEVFHHFKKPIPGEPVSEDCALTREIVFGQEFVDPRTNERMTFGFTKKVKDILHLPFGAFQDMSKHITKLHSENNRLSRENERLQWELNEGYRKFEVFAGMSWYKRLLFLFVGRGMYKCPEAGDE